jgi:hypothetical protein
LPPRKRGRSVPAIARRCRSMAGTALRAFARPTTSRLCTKHIPVDLTIFLCHPHLTLSMRGAFRGCLDGGTGAAPAGEAHDLALGRLRDPARPALRPVCREPAGLGQARATSQEARPGVGSTRLRGSGGRAAVERREAGVLRQRTRRARQRGVEVTPRGAPPPSLRRGSVRKPRTRNAPREGDCTSQRHHMPMLPSSSPLRCAHRALAHSAKAPRCGFFALAGRRRRDNTVSPAGDDPTKRRIIAGAGALCWRRSDLRPPPPRPKHRPGGPERQSKRKQPDRSIRLFAFRTAAGRLALAADRVAALAVAGLGLAVGGGLRGGLIRCRHEHRRECRDGHGKQYCCDYRSNHRFPRGFPRRAEESFRFKLSTRGAILPQVRRQAVKIPCRNSPCVRTWRIGRLNDLSDNGDTNT